VRKKERERRNEGKRMRKLTCVMIPLLCVIGQE